MSRVAWIPKQACSLPTRPCTEAWQADTGVAVSGATDAATDFRFLAGALSWVSDPGMEPYQGEPRTATAKAGDAMLNYHAETALELFAKAWAGKPVRQKPLGWSIRNLRNIV